MTGSSNRFLAYWSTGDNFRDAQNRAETRLAAQGTQALPDNSPCEEKTRKKNADFSRLLWEFFFCIFLALRRILGVTLRTTERIHGTYAVS